MGSPRGGHSPGSAAAQTAESNTDISNTFPGTTQPGVPVLPGAVGAAQLASQPPPGK